MFRRRTFDGRLVLPCGISRSGTTLLTTILDTHPELSLGYELIPAPLDAGLLGLLSQLEEAIAADEVLVDLGSQLRGAGHRNEGLFFTRCARAGLSAAQTQECLHSLRDEYRIRRIQSVEERLTVAYVLAAKKAVMQGNTIFGFKLNMQCIAETAKLFPHSRVVYILRDPRDVVLSQQKRGFDRTVKQMCAAWNCYLENFECFQKKQPGRAALVRYEDLVRFPERTLRSVFDILPVDFLPELLEFHKSDKASVHSGGHPNADALKQSFFTSSIGRWTSSLSEADVQETVTLCRAGMERHGYELTALTSTDGKG